jgi:hypothetical protein
MLYVLENVSSQQTRQNGAEGTKSGMSAAWQYCSELWGLVSRTKCCWFQQTLPERMYVSGFLQVQSLLSMSAQIVFVQLQFGLLTHHR